MAPIHLIASSDDFLLEEKIREITRAASEDMGGVEPEVLPPDLTPEDLATELCSPSLFAPHRVFVAPDLNTWLEAPPKGEKTAADQDVVDVKPVIDVLAEGLSQDIALVMGACCRSKPKGPFVTAVSEAGTFEWLPAPDSVKPWEEAELSEDQERVLRGVIAREAGDVTFTDGAQKLLMHRLGYAPRLLIQEVSKLVAAHVDQRVDEDLVRALCFPKERSLEVVRDAVFAHRAEPILDVLAAAEVGVAVRDWHGQLMRPESVPVVIATQVGTLLGQMLYLRRLAARVGMERELSPDRTGQPRWYPSRFKSGLGPTLLEQLKNDAPSPLVRPGKRPMSLFALGQLFKGTSRWTDGELVDALAGYGEMEAGLRGSMPTEDMSVWLVRALGEGSARDA